MKTTGIIGFIFIILADVILFFTSMNMPAGSKTGSVFLIIALIELILVILYFIAALKEKNTLSLISSILILIIPACSFLITGRWYNADLSEYGSSLNADTAFKVYVLLIILSIIFGILGIVLGSAKKKK